MLAEERYSIILDFLNINKTATVAQLAAELDTSESTVRRDLISLASMNKIIKVHGGATVADDSFDFAEPAVEAKQKLFSKEKDAIAKYAASMIRKNDFVYIDAGTTTEKMIDYITETSATFVTNGFNHAQRLAKRHLNVQIIGGKLKETTEAVIGTESVCALEKFNFTKCFMGTNGIDINSGFTTHDIDEANVKEAATKNSYVVYVLADHSKFNVQAAVTFAKIDNACIVTDYLPDDRYREMCIIKEVAE